MKTIWKYPCPIKDSFALELPQEAVVLSVQVQNEQPCIWVMVDDQKPTEVRFFGWRGTGHNCAFDVADYRFVGTVQLHSGQLVFHLFEQS